ESRGGTIPQNEISHANPLFKRHGHGKCYDYLVLVATFDDVNGLTGVVTLAGDDSVPDTFVYGLFSRGIEDPEKFNIFLKDSHGKIVYNLTDDLHLKFDGKGGTKPFCAYIDLDIFKFFYGDGGKRKRQTGPSVGTSSPAATVPVEKVKPSD
ncbi:6001_t:CDS:1, partial [Cetraspora pellucida]